MKTREKLNLFYEAALNAANERSSQDMREFSASMEQMVQEFRKQKREEMEARYQTEAGTLLREKNRRVSEAQTEQKRRLNGYQQEKKALLFAAVEAKLAGYRGTPEYQDYLAGKIRMARAFARQEAVEIYLDTEDAFRREALERECGCGLLVSETSFGGGIRAKVPSKNILIDESFETKLNQERDAYSF